MSTFIEGLLLKLYFLFTTHCCRYLMSPLLQTGKLRHRNLGEPGRLTHRRTVTWPFPSELSGILRQLRTCTVAGTRGLGHEEVAGKQGTTCMNGTGGLRPSIPQGCCSLSSSRPGLGQGFSIRSHHKGWGPLEANSHCQVPLASWWCLYGQG